MLSCLPRFCLGMLAMFWKERKTVFGKFMIAFWFATGFSGFYYNIWELKMYTMFYFLIFGTFASHTNQYVKLKMKISNLLIKLFGL